METLRVIVGDWSGDGHMKTSTYVVQANVTGKELQEAYKAGVEKCGFDISSCCEEYEDNLIPKDLYEYFSKAGVKYDSIEEEDEVERRICTDDFFEIYMKTCEIGNPDLKWTQEKGYENVIHVGGYGLFYS